MFILFNLKSAQNRMLFKLEMHFTLCNNKYKFQDIWITLRYLAFSILDSKIDQN